MSGYLVLLRHTMDDLPVRLFAHTKAGKNAAMRFAGKMRRMPTKKIRGVFGTDCSTPVGVAVVEFVNGEPREIAGWISHVD